jgi:methyl-accepting chemotaxis protein
VNMAVSQMDKVTQSNAANAEENAASSEELNAQAASLQDMVVQLELLTLGYRRSAVTPEPSFQPVKRKPTNQLPNSWTKPAQKPAAANRDEAAAAFGSSLAASPKTKAETKVGEFQSF